MATVYKDYMFRVSASHCKCEICKSPIRENNLAAACATCGSYVCEDCVKSGVGETHICKDEFDDIPVYPNAKKPVVATMDRFRIYA